MEKELSKIYYDPDVNTSSAKRLLQAAKDRGIKVKQREVDEFIKKQEAFQTTRTFKAPREFSSIIAPRSGSNLQIDLMELKTRYKIKGTPYLLNVVDIHSRKAWSIPLPNKESSTVTKAMSELIDIITKEQKQYRGIPLDLKVKGKLVSHVKSINSDAGGEFESKIFKDMLKSKTDKYNFPIKQYVSDPKDYSKNAIVERFNRTFRRLMLVDKKQRNNKPQTREDVARHVKNYNNDIHSTIKAKPEMVYKLEDKNKQKYRFIDFKLGKGDRVRTLNKNALFEKGTYEYSDKVYMITEKNGKRYKLEGLKKPFMGYELLLVEDLQHSPSYEQVIVDANREAELKDLEQDRMEKTMNKDLGKGSKKNIIEVVERAPDIVGKTIEVKYDGEGPFKQSKLSPERGEKGTFYKGEVRKFDKKSRKHQVFSPFDKKIVWLDFTNKDSRDYIAPRFWRRS
eukprot:SAG11_NODE_1458_length_4874_cov_218.142827_8_plen_453_part_00